MIELKDLREGASYLVKSRVFGTSWIAQVTKIEYIGDSIYTIKFKDIFDINSGELDLDYFYSEQNFLKALIIEKVVNSKTNPEYFL